MTQQGSHQLKRDHWLHNFLSWQYRNVSNLGRPTWSSMLLLRIFLVHQFGWRRRQIVAVALLTYRLGGSGRRGLLSATHRHSLHTRCHLRWQDDQKQQLISDMDAKGTNIFSNKSDLTLVPCEHSTQCLHDFCFLFQNMPLPSVKKYTFLCFLDDFSLTPCSHKNISSL